MRVSLKPRTPNRTYWMLVMQGHTPSAPNCAWNQPGDFTDPRSMCGACLHLAEVRGVIVKGTNA
jgi:hypothetical protein